MNRLDIRPRLASAVVALCLAAAAAPLAAQQVLPRLTIDPQQIDFGRMEQQEARHITVTLRNDGQAPLKIDNVETSCGCTVADPQKTVLQPGESTPLEVTFNSQMFEGKQLKLIEIHTNDPRDRVQEIEIRADVHAPLHVIPIRRALTFNRVAAGDSVIQGVTVSTEDVPELQITPAHFRKDLFRVTVAPKPGAGPNTRIVRIELRPDAPIGVFREIVSCTTNVPGGENLDIETSGEVLAPVSVEPATVNFRYAMRGREMRRTFQVRVKKGSGIKVTRAEVDLPRFQVTGIEFDEKTSSYMVTVKGDPLSRTDQRAIADQGHIKGTLRIYTDSPDYPELTATIMYLLRL